MNILAISSILPIPEIKEDNDFVYQIYLHYIQCYPEARIVILKPVKISLNPRSILFRRGELNQYKGNLQRKIHGFRVEIIPFLSIWSRRNLHSIVSQSVYYLNRKRLRRLLQGFRPDIMHAQFIFPDGILARHLSLQYGIPYVITTHNELFYLDHFISRRIARKILQDGAGILPINHSNYSRFRSLGMEHVTISPLGFHDGFIRPQKREVSEITRILTVARLLPLKNIDNVIRALSGLPGDNKFEYTIVGDGEERDRLEGLAHSLGLADRIIFKASVPYSMIADEMYQHDIFIMPSYYETFGRVYFEAMAMGIPVICAKGSGIYGLFREREEGISVRHDDINAIASILEELIGDRELRLKIGIQGQELVKNYTWQNIGKALHQKYLECTTIKTRSGEISH